MDKEQGYDDHEADKILQDLSMEAQIEDNETSIGLLEIRAEAMNKLYYLLRRTN